MKRILAMLTVILLVSSCSSSMPEWYRDRDNYFPESDYLWAKGWGETPEKAIEDAIIELSRIFGNKLSVEKNVLERYESISDSKDQDMYESYYEFSTEFATFVSNQNLVNVRYKDPVREGRNKTYFTIAYLERDKTASILMNKLARIEEDVEFNLKAGKNSHDLLEKYRFLNTAWLTSAKATMLQEQLDVLAPGIKIRMKYKLDELAQMKDKVAEQISFNIRGKNISDRQIKQALGKVINDNGFKLVDTEAMMTLVYSVNMEELDLHRDKLVFIAWNFDIKLSDWKKQTLLSLYKQGKEGSLDIYNAKTHAVKHIQDYIDTEFREEFKIFFDQPKKEK